jgi:hypothetical protein
VNHEGEGGFSGCPAGGRQLVGDHVYTTLGATNDSDPRCWVPVGRNPWTRKIRRFCWESRDL